MVKYKVNFKFKENGRSLNQIVTEILKIKINNIVNKTCNILKLELSLKSNNYFRVGERKI